MCDRAVHFLPPCLDCLLYTEDCGEELQRMFDIVSRYTYEHRYFRSRMCVEYEWMRET